MYTSLSIGSDRNLHIDYLNTVSSQEFFILVTLEWTEQSKTSCSHSKKHNESKNAPAAIKVLSLTRPQFVTMSLAAHALQNAFIPGPTSGPGMKIVWTGFAYVF